MDQRKKTCCLGSIRDYTTQLGFLLNKQYSMESKKVFSWLKWIKLIKKDLIVQKKHVHHIDEAKYRKSVPISRFRNSRHRFLSLKGPLFHCWAWRNMMKWE